MMVVNKNTKKIICIKLMQKASVKCLKQLNIVNYIEDSVSFKKVTPVLYESNIGVVYISSEENIQRLIDKIQLDTNKFNGSRKRRNRGGIKLRRKFEVIDLKEYMGEEIIDYRRNITASSSKNLYKKIVELFEVDKEEITEKDAVRKLMVLLTKVSRA